MLNDQAFELNFVLNRLETFRKTVLLDVEKRMSGMIDEVMQELRQHQLQAIEFRNFATPQLYYQSGTHSNCTKGEILKQTSDECEEANNESPTTTTTKNVPPGAAIVGGSPQGRSLRNQHNLSSKVFVMRESLLTALFGVDHIKTIYHIFYTIFLVFLFNNVSYEYFVKGSISFGLGIFRAGFESIHKVAGIWILQHIFVIGIFFALKGWSQIRTKLTRHKSVKSVWSYSCLLIYIVLQLIFAYIPTKICFYLNLPFVSAEVLLLETIRLLMKMHSFVRTVTPRALAGKVKAEEQSAKEVNFPTFGKYLYFLFAPTLLYRDNYPRNSTIRWKFAFSRLLEVISVAFLFNYVYERHIKHHFGSFGLEELNTATMIMKLFGMLMPSIIVYLTGFYMILHAWLNFTAEVLRFGDRMFYRDWWTASNYEAYYRNWNVVVHDWLYEYIYKDIYNHCFKGSKGLSSLTVFIISAVFHEYALGYALQVFIPVMILFFGVVGMLCIFLTRYTPKNLGNIFLWFSLIHGSSWVISLYSMEYFASINCPKEINSWSDYFVPHIWTCFAK